MVRIFNNNMKKKDFQHFLKAVKNNEFLQVESMLKKDSKLIHAKDSNNNTALLLANSNKMLELLIKYGADVDIKNKFGRTALHRITCLPNMKESMELLISKGADVNARDRGNATPIHDAVSRGYFDVVEFLISKGADVNAKDSNRFTPLQIALEEVLEDEGIPIADLLRQHGAKE